MSALAKLPALVAVAVLFAGCGGTQAAAPPPTTEQPTSLFVDLYQLDVDAFNAESAGEGWDRSAAAKGLCAVGSAQGELTTTLITVANPLTGRWLQVFYKDGQHDFARDNTGYNFSELDWQGFLEGTEVVCAFVPDGIAIYPKGDL